MDQIHSDSLFDEQASLITNQFFKALTNAPELFRTEFYLLNKSMKQPKRQLQTHHQDKPGD